MTGYKKGTSFSLFLLQLMQLFCGTLYHHVNWLSLRWLNHRNVFNSHFSFFYFSYSFDVILKFIDVNSNTRIRDQDRHQSKEHCGRLLKPFDWYFSKRILFLSDCNEDVQTTIRLSAKITSYIFNSGTKFASKFDLSRYFAILKTTFFFPDLFHLMLRCFSSRTGTSVLYFALNDNFAYKKETQTKTK